ncbi:Protein msta, isoform A [Armadillidium nasatum]|uniref:Protein msta, isoform A n=1 Tax=Armadillidium nasatum TaxID=96803 RepID=A0A5N5TI59_9CRUS|nr:Protein msta, isoform A [Armadillidium nasatum]
MKIKKTIPVLYLHTNKGFSFNEGLIINVRSIVINISTMNYDGKINIMYDWFEFSKKETSCRNAIPPGCLDHIDFKKPIKWELKVIQPYGRCLVAKEDIKEGEILFIDYPVVTGPKQNCEPLCLGCYKQLDVSETYECSKCGWPMCGSECEDKGYHPLECEAFVASGYKPKLEDFSECNPMYESVLPLRCLLLEKKHPKKWETLIAMESHDELRKDTELWETEQKNVVEFLQEKVKIKHSSELIHRVTGILDVNCHEVRSNIPDTKNEFRARGIYPLCAMMSHDCSSNTHHTVMDEMVMLVLASRNIYKGTQITGTYTHLLSGTIEEKKAFKIRKIFRLCL